MGGAMNRKKMKKKEKKLKKKKLHCLCEQCNG
jgi:hypothetical protein